jgi:hypothetical protein
MFLTVVEINWLCNVIWEDLTSDKEAGCNIQSNSSQKRLLRALGGTNPVILSHEHFPTTGRGWYCTGLLHFLAGVHLLLLLALECSDQAKNKIHADGASLLSRLIRALADCVPLAFWNKPDFDAVRQICDEVKHIHDMKRICVKGHQDLATGKQLTQH